jgi:hypothetical protein
MIILGIRMIIMYVYVTVRKVHGEIKCMFHLMPYHIYPLVKQGFTTIILFKNRCHLMFRNEENV